MTIMPGMGPNMGQGGASWGTPEGGWFKMLQQASPLLMAMGQNMATPPQMRDPAAMQRGMAGVMAMQQQRAAEEQRAKQQAAIQQVLQSGQIPQGLAGVLGAMEPQQAAGTLAQVMMGGAEKPQRYRVGDQLVDADGNVIYSAPERGGAASPQTMLAKLRADLDAGFITPEQYEAAVSKATTASGGITIGPDGTVQIGGPQSLPKAPSGFTYVPGEQGGMELRPIAGGPAEQISAEIAGRIGLAEDALTQLPGLIEQARAGDLTGPIDYLSGRLGFGQQGAARRENMAGSEAITRMLTGAGMNIAEAEREAQLYIVGPMDGPESAVSKLTQLQRRLEGLVDMATRGRRGGVSLDPQTGMGATQPQPSQAPSVAPGPFNIPPQVQEAARTAPEGSVIEGPGGIRLVVRGGQLVRQ